MGMFYVKDPSKNIAHLFSHWIYALPKFSARGYKYDRRRNNCKYLFEAKKIQMKQIEAIGDKFLADGSGWSNKASFVMIDITPKYKKLFGEATVPECA